MSLLTVIQTACDRLSLTRPVAVASSTDKLVRQLFSIVNEAGEALSKRGDPGFQSLQAEWTFVTSATAEQTNTPLPEDLRRFVPGSFFNRTTAREIVGPLTPRDWQRNQAQGPISAVYLGFRERSGDFLMSPTPAAGETIAYEYISKYWAKSATGVAKPAFVVDEDETYLDEELLVLEIKWRWKHAKGLDYGEDMATAEREIALALGGDGGAGLLSISSGADPYGAVNIPQTIPV
jgi:hypothetical protein